MTSSSFDPVVITGYGVVSAAGLGAAALRRAIEANTCHLGPLDDTITRGLSVREGGRVPIEAGRHPDDPAEPCRFSLLCRLAAAEALRHAGIRGDFVSDPEPIRVGLSIGTALAGIDAGVENDRRAATPVAHRPDLLLDELARSLRLSGPLSLFSATCVSSLYALEQARLDLARDPSVAILCGGADTLGRFMQAGFASLGTLESDAVAGARPLGGRFLLGEAAAFVVLETRTSALSRGVPILGAIAGQAIRSDARHLTSPDPDGAAMTSAIEAALLEAGRSPEDIGCVSLTAVNSPPYARMYRNVLARVFASREVPTSTWEASVGHVLASSGTLGLVHALFRLDRAGRLAANGDDVLALTVGFGGQNGATVIASAASPVAGPRRRDARSRARSDEAGAPVRLAAWGAATDSPSDLEDWFPSRWSASRALHPESAVLAHAAALALEGAGWWRRGSGRAVDGGLIVGADCASREPALRFRRSLESGSRSAAIPSDFLFSLPSSPAAMLGILFGLVDCQTTLTHLGLSGFKAVSFGLDLLRARRPRRVLVAALSALGKEGIDFARRTGEASIAEAAPFTMATALCLEVVEARDSRPGDVLLEECDVPNANDRRSDESPCEFESIESRSYLDSIPPACRGLAAPSLLALIRLASALIREPRRVALTHEDPCSERLSRLVVSASSDGEGGEPRGRSTWSPKSR